MKPRGHLPPKPRGYLPMPILPGVIHWGWMDPRVMGEVLTRVRCHRLTPGALELCPTASNDCSGLHIDMVWKRKTNVQRDL